ncbi:helix-turn-helix transcriptional regulator [Vibrio maritimus]|nr:helix-turn-helix transcriptional regulator [Vibrio maritimus]
MKYEQFNVRLRTLKQQRRLSCEQIADAMSVTRRTVQSWLTGTSQPKADQIYRLAKVMRVTPNDLFYLASDGDVQESMILRVNALVNDLPVDHQRQLMALMGNWIELTEPFLRKAS